MREVTHVLFDPRTLSTSAILSDEQWDKGGWALLRVVPTMTTYDGGKAIEAMAVFERGEDKPTPYGCICPPMANHTCQAVACPRRAAVGGP
jgi:hypothetical protein